jgi:hypothetical protein
VDDDVVEATASGEEDKGDSEGGDRLCLLVLALLALALAAMAWMAGCNDSIAVRLGAMGDWRERTPEDKDDESIDTATQRCDAFGRAGGGGDVTKCEVQPSYNHDETRHTERERRSITDHKLPTGQSGLTTTCQPAVL